MKITNKLLLKYSLLAALTCFSGLLLAQSAESRGGPRKPPREAIDACKNLSSNQECSFSSQGGSVTGTCWAPEGKPLACKSNDAPGDQKPPEKQ